MKHPNVNRLFAALVVALFITSYFPQIATTLGASQDNNWVGQPMHILLSAEPLSYPFGISPSQIKTAYELPSTGGNGSTIAIIDAGDTPNVTNDLTTFSTTFNLTTPTNENFEIVKMPGVGNATSNWMMETCLDVEWAHAIAPDAKILLVEAKSAYSYDLLSAVDYARNQTDVVAVSMSWGGLEFFGETNADSHFTSNHGAVFFASSGDNGSSTGVIWPASSRNVVGVGGTTLKLNFDGSVISETAWNGSGGGVSSYESQPNYQTTYGLNNSHRTVPDVSYDAGEGVSVYSTANGGWISAGGTSAGAPQWAAIQALGLSATNTNLYDKAKLAYSSYFRDITSGSNGAFNATAAYDYVTGLGSPLTFDFSSHLSVYPASGPAGGSIILNGVGFTPESSVNISYLNPETSSWVSIANNSAVLAQNFTFSFKAPDSLENNIPNDSQPLFDDIIFRAQDNSNGNYYNTTIPYKEWHRGLTQITNVFASGIYGNNTDLSTTAFVQNNQPITVAGVWFNPGNVSLMLDGTSNVGSGSTDSNGFFNLTVQIPTLLAGKHMLTIRDSDSNFLINVTRLPIVTDNYDGQWHTSPFNITLTPDYNVSETYYSINGGQILSVSANGQPFTISDGSNSTLEYWSAWNVYGTGNMNLTHVTLTGIQLDTTSPQGSILINDGETTTQSNAVTLAINATDAVSGINQMRFSNDNASWDQSQWMSYSTNQNWQLTSGDGVKTVYCQIKDNAGLITNVSSSIILSTPQQPTQTLMPPASSTPIPTQAPLQTPTPSPTFSPMPQASPLAIVPELSIQMFLILAALTTLLFAVAYKRKNL